VSPRRVYLDYNATTPLCPGVREAVAAALDLAGNPSSVHEDGRAARRVIEGARRRIAALVHARPQDVVFTSGGSEANNLAIDSLVRLGVIDTAVVSAIEHPSVGACLKSWAGDRLSVVPLACGADGAVEAAAVAQALRALGSRASRTLVCVMLANNETGVVQPVRDIAEIAHGFGAFVLCDAVQAVGRIAVDCEALGVDFLSVSAHKFGGPKGAGALIVRNGMEISPSLRGGGQELRRRAGTENVPGLAGFGAAAEQATERFGQWQALAALRDGMEAQIRRIAPETTFFGLDRLRLPNTSCFATHGLSAEQQVIAMDLAGVSIGAGSACSSGKMTPSEVLMAMGAPADQAANAIRVSLGPETTQRDIDCFVRAWQACYARNAKQNLKQTA